MNGVLLAAGTGSRLRDRTAHLPKALLPVQSKPLIDYALSFIKNLGFKRVVVVVGFQADQVRDHLRADREIVVVENPQYLKANLLTLLAAGEHLQDGFAVFNVDHIYPVLLKRVFHALEGRVTALCDFDRSLGPDDMKVLTDQGKYVHKISKTLEEFDAGYIGSTIVPKEAVKAYFEAVFRVQEQHGEKAVVEHVLADLAQTKFPPCVADTSGIRWLEVDDETDLQRAEDALRQNPKFLT